MIEAKVLDEVRFSGPEACKIAGVSRATLHRWSDLLTVPHSGPGSKTYLSVRQMSAWLAGIDFVGPHVFGQQGGPHGSPASRRLLATIAEFLIHDDDWSEFLAVSWPDMLWSEEPSEVTRWALDRKLGATILPLRPYVERVLAA